MWLMQSYIGKKGTLDGRTLGLTGTWEQVEDEQGEQPDGGRQARLARGPPLGRPSWKGSADERCRPADRSAVQVDGRSAPGQERGEKMRV